MHKYMHHIGDFMRDTNYLTSLEECFYRRALDFYYLNEKPLPKETQVVMKRLRAITQEERDALTLVLNDFFILEDDGFHNKRCDSEIAIYQGNADKNRKNGKLGGRPKKNNDLKNPKKTQVVFDENPIESQSKDNQQPTTNNQQPTTNITNNISDKPKKNSNVKNLIPSDFGISDQVRKWASENNHHNLEKHLEGFIDYANSGAKKYADWDSAFKRAIREDWFKVNKPVYQNGYQQPQNTRMQEIEELSKKWEQDNESSYQPY